jgi:hypothetical protein
MIVIGDKLNFMKVSIQKDDIGQVFNSSHNGYPNDFIQSEEDIFNDGYTLQLYAILLTQKINHQYAASSIENTRSSCRCCRAWRHRT